MLGWKIFLHSFRMVFGNLRQVLQITVGPAIIGTLVLFGLALVFGATGNLSDQMVSGFASGSPENVSPIFGFLTLVVVAAVMGWIAVSWHRFVLLEEYPEGFLPVFRSDRVIAYILRILLIGVIAVIAFLPTGLVFAALGEGLIAVSTILLVVYAIVLAVCFFRIAIILPAAALGEPLSIRNAWKKTTGTTGSIIALMIVAVVFQFCAELVFSILLFIPVLGLLLFLFFMTLVLPMINVSVLTTMYGIFVEGRELT